MKTDNEYLEKAEELITIFHNLRYDGLNDVRDVNAAVRCALITVDEIMKSCARYPYGIEYLSQIDFWEGVKNELNSMCRVLKPLEDCPHCNGSGGVATGADENGNTIYSTCPCVN